MQNLADSPNQGKTIRRPSIRSYLVMMNVILLCLLFPAGSILFLREDAKFRDVQLEQTLQQMRQALENRGSALVRNMSLSAGYAVAGYDFTLLNNLVRQVVEEDDEIVYCLIMDAKRTVVAHSDPEKLGSVLAGVKDQQAAALLSNSFLTMVPEDNDTQVRFIDEAEPGQGGEPQILEALAPIYNGSRLFAVLRCGYSLEGHTSRIRAAKQDWERRSRQFKIYLVSITAIFFTIGLLIAILFTRAFVQSMQVVSDGVSRVAEGDLTHQIEPGSLVCAELVSLSGAFNAMTGELRRSRRQLDDHSKSLEDKVAARTHELKNAQDNLLKQAHEAGMAEMAVGILHNIGNAITPAKVGLVRLFSRLRKKPLLENLPAALDEIEKKLTGSETLTESQIKRLVEIIQLVPATIGEEYTLYADEVEQVRHKLLHIEGIIGLQMRYAHLFGDSESVEVHQVVEDALTLLEDALRKRSVRVVKDFETAPPIRIEKAQLIQIVINLIKNGYEAMEKVDPRQRELFIAIRFRKGPPEYLVLTVQDRGIGFTGAEQKKLFKFGYSTKVKGSGFGLHSCANYLIARNGSITASSDGHGKGAQFEVRLPLSERKGMHAGGTTIEDGQ